MGEEGPPGFTPDLYTLYGWASAQLFVQALQAAGKNPTRGELLSQLQKITSFSASNLIGSSNPAKKLPPNCYIMAKIVNGKYQRVDDRPTVATVATRPTTRSMARSPKSTLLLSTAGRTGMRVVEKPWRPSSHSRHRIVAGAIYA